MTTEATPGNVPLSDQLGPLLEKHGIASGFDGGPGLRYKSTPNHFGNYVVRTLTADDIAAVVEDAVAAERERCAKVCEDLRLINRDADKFDCAHAIRYGA